MMDKKAFVFVPSKIPLKMFSLDTVLLLLELFLISTISQLRSLSILGSHQVVLDGKKLYIVTPFKHKKTAQ